MQNNLSKNIKLFLVAIIFVLPVIVSWGLYYFHGSLHLKTLNYGVLTREPMPIKELMQGQENKRTWQIVYVPNSCINSQDEKHMFMLHQLRKVLGNDRDRVSLTLMMKPTVLLKTRMILEKFY